MMSLLGMVGEARYGNVPRQDQEQDITCLTCEDTQVDVRSVRVVLSTGQFICEPVARYSNLCLA
jgi:hypothetical protein